MEQVLVCLLALLVAACASFPACFLLYRVREKHARVSVMTGIGVTIFSFFSIVLALAIVFELQRASFAVFSVVLLGAYAIVWLYQIIRTKLWMRR